jgi:hypothetical protein
MTEYRLQPAPTETLKLWTAEVVAVVTVTPEKLVPPEFAKYAAPAPENGAVSGAYLGE